jgi:hypothetical protein
MSLVYKVETELKEVIMAVLKSVALSLLASAAATYLLRAILSAQSGTTGAGGDRVVIVIVPIIAGNSSNRIGYIKEVRPFWPWGRE